MIYVKSMSNYQLLLDVR